ncbi:hypothetical protein B0J18DRAFT_41463 [Chaetomium sp. MPI-SDFR-AT-0129]|nr:hypothetical protein B0J18DRAFT_41463 [Chaetomium sp. MPI-SDFR-AT-0129]
MHNFLEPASPESSDTSTSQGSHSRRIHQPDLHTDTVDALRVPLRPEPGDKTRRRESRLGLRNIFGRGKGGDDNSRPSTPRDASQRLGGIRASFAEINWPYGSQNGQGHRSEISLPSLSRVLPSGPALKHKKSESVVRPQHNAEKCEAPNSPPLYQAYRQAIKHAQLSACTVPAEVVLRMHTHKSSASLAGLLNPRALDGLDDLAGEKPKRGHRRNGSGSAPRFEWTTKVYILTTSGHLLQYASEGTYDRHPERVLELGKDSAAFASDAIPGRHWVVQVSSVADADHSPGPQSSLRARLPFRGAERRPSPAFLMVFESAEDMESWIAALRREIEKLGGRKVLSETGRPKIGTDENELKSQAPQRTAVPKTPSRFSQVMTADQTWDGSLPISSPAQDSPAREQSFDGTSTSSFISHEGRQLDSLRDSYNRLSYISSSQRTMVTSVGSSPACSPIRDSFGELDSMSEFPEYEDASQPRMRPNAMAIIDRRQSVQALNHVLGMGASTAQTPHRPASTYSNMRQPESSAPFTSASLGPTKRLSFARATPGAMPTQSSASPLLSRMGSRRPPPTALSINPRPLSLVEDQPSPALSSLSRGTVTEGTSTPPSGTPLTPAVTLPSPHRAESELAKRIREESLRDSGISTQENTADVVPPMDRRYSKDFVPTPSPRASTFPLQDQPPRSNTSLGTYAEPSPFGPQTFSSRPRRVSFNSAPQVDRSSLLSPSPYIRSDAPQTQHQPQHQNQHATATLPEKSAPRSSQYLRLEPPSHPVLQRRSWSQPAPSQSDAGGPPPAPPPNRALPPLPPKFNSVPPPGFI